MTTTVKVNPDILRWARETAGLSLEEASRKIQLKVTKKFSPIEKLQALEAGNIEPSRALLLRMVKQYHRPLILFYMEKPPRKADRGQDFRILPTSYPDITKGLVDALIRDVQVRQSILRAAIEDDDDVEYLPFVNSMKISDGIDTVVQSILDKTKFVLEKYRNLPNQRDAFKYLRSQIENIGVYVLLIGDLGSHHTAFEVDEFRGFAIADKIAPFIVINNNDSQAAWSFTLIHELVHIWLGHSGISGGDINSDLRIETFSNRVASSILLSEEDLAYIKLNASIDYEDQKEIISDFANLHNISSSMVAYRLYLNGSLDLSTWKRLNRDFRNYWREAKNEQRVLQKVKSSGPTYYVVRGFHLGDNLITQVNQMILGGSMTTVNAGKVLGVSPQNVGNLIESKISFRPQ